MTWAIKIAFAFPTGEVLAIGIPLSGDDISMTGLSDVSTGGLLPCNLNYFIRKEYKKYQLKIITNGEISSKFRKVPQNSVTCEPLYELYCTIP